MTARDPRLHAYRPDLADERLRGEVDAARFVSGRAARVAVAVADIRKAPRADAGLSTQALYGDDIRVFDVADGWAWVQADADGYVGYVADAAIAEPDRPPTHVVVVPRTFLYPGPDLKLPRSGELSMGSRVAITGGADTRGTEYALLASGEAAIAKHLAPLEKIAVDYVAVAETLIHTPYLWGGLSGFGIDCSGLVQLAMRMAGKRVLRDSDMQAATIGTAIEPGADFAGLAPRRPRLLEGPCRRHDRPGYHDSCQRPHHDRRERAAAAGDRSYRLSLWRADWVPPAAGSS